MLAKMVAGGTMETPDVLYENTSPTTTYAGGTIVTASQLAGYKYVVIAFEYGTNATSNIKYIISKIYDSTTTPEYYSSGQLIGISGGDTASSYTNPLWRGISINKGGIVVSNGTNRLSDTLPQAAVPIKVWGFKGNFPFELS